MLHGTSLGSEKDELRQKLVLSSEYMCSLLREVGLIASTCSAERLTQLCKTSATIDSKFSNIVDDISLRIQDEIRTRWCFIITQEEAVYYAKASKVLGDIVESKFSTSVYDIDEAGKCFALGRYTACVYHLMRVMEIGVRQFGHLVTQKDDIREKEWQKVINNIRNHIESLYQSERERKRIKYESLLALLETVKISWRNPTMHPKETYTEEEARAIINSVKVFMAELANQMP